MPPKILLLKDIPTPAFVINRYAFSKNCQSALEHARKHNLKLRPHVKTHKTIEGAYIQVTGQINAKTSSGSPFDSTVSGFVASTLPEIAMLVDAAEKYGGAPFNDILFGVPVSGSKLSRLFELQQKLRDGQIRIMVDHIEQIRQVESFLNAGETDFPKQVSTFLKLDTGYHRAGVPCDERGVQVAMAIIRSPALDFFGVYSHCGHAYDECHAEERDKIAIRDIDAIEHFLTLLQDTINSAVDCSGFATKDLIVSVGSTPSLVHHSPKIENLVEIHPGNYTLYDRQQLWTGACTDETAVAGRVMAKVIGHYEDRNTLLLDAGALALTKDLSPQGGMCQITGFPELEAVSMSQEVTKVRPRDPDLECPYEKLPIGSTVSLLPNHSCLSAACFDKYFIIDDSSCNFSPEEPVTDVWIPVKYFT